MKRIIPSKKNFLELVSHKVLQSSPKGKAILLKIEFSVNLLKVKSVKNPNISN